MEEDRIVEIFEYNRVPGQTYSEPVSTGERGFFRQFGVDYADLEVGVGNYSTAIIEMDDGTVRNIPVELIKFV